MKHTFFHGAGFPLAPRAALLAALGLLAWGGPARAQNVELSPAPAAVEQINPVTKQPIRDANGHILYNNVSINRPYYLSFSPYTSVFQFRDANRSATGLDTIDRTSHVGPYIELDRVFTLPATPRGGAAAPNGGGQSIILGGWYWYHGGSDINRDRFAITGRYNYNPQFGLQLNAGGSTVGGFFEYYGFLLYTPPIPAVDKVSVTVGAGPYVPKSTLGNTGYTLTFAAAYRFASQYSVSAGVWYLDFTRPTQQFGGGNFTDSTARYNLAVTYNF